MSIHDWPAAERPREKLLTRGADALSDAELLAIFLRVGIVGYSAVDLARLLLNHFGSLNGVFSAPRAAFSQIAGMGDAKYAQLQAVLEMARRALHEDISHSNALTSPQTVRDYLALLLRNRRVECFVALLLDAGHRVLACVELSQGSLNQTQVYPQEVASQALQHHACAIIVAHNHPSGRVQPSAADINLTQTLRDALQLIDVRLLDHFIIAGSQSYSFAEHKHL
ncbi:RadC family protein [Silvimonas amylolytica]|uniref:UPF0758 protein n=1 Tax=Silvimonas amylolytica TaxID=449663 RepID=A0ABQ2PLW5_9NEIS|nr:DNA repair protein RadC [Silvimonas amylolytica]GGP26396.1 UPF0758 protein [Silvimonas amylolytica]